MNEKIKETLNIYFDNLAEALNDFKKGEHIYNAKKYYKEGFYAFYEIIKNKYENKYRLKSVFAAIANKGVEPKIYIKDNPRITSDEGIFIYISLSNNKDDRKVNISLELGKVGRYDNKDDLYEKALGKLQKKYKNEINKVLAKIMPLNGLKVVNDKSIINIEITDFKSIIPILEILEITYDKIIEDVKSYQNANDTWEIIWEKYQEDVLEEVYIPSKEKKKNNFETNKNSNINDSGHNELYYGIPGCGKSKHIELAYGLTKDNSTRITFHPDYTNSDFIGQIIPKKDKDDDTKIHYDFEAGPFTKALKNALEREEKKEPYYLVIEEINRGNASAIFGDIFQILDRDENGESEYQIDNYAITDYLSEKLKKEIPKVYLPSNLYILATMNTNDQNVYVLDTAFKRRWEPHLITNDFDDEIPYDKKLKKLLVPKTNYTWEDFVTEINNIILEKNKNQINNEDKQIGKYFVSKRELVTEEDDEKTIAIKQKRFGEKVLMYIWEDIAKINISEWFSEYRSYEELLKAYNANSEKIINELIGNNNE